MTWNPISDAERHTAKTENIDDFPVCDICGNHMTEGVELADGTRVCDDCFSFKTFEPEVA